MDNFSRKSLQHLANAVNGNMAAFSSAVAETFKEVYENMEAIDEKVGGCSYSPESETLVVPSMMGSVADETLTFQ